MKLAKTAVVEQVVHVGKRSIQAVKNIRALIGKHTHKTLINLTCECATVVQRRSRLALHKLDLRTAHKTLGNQRLGIGGNHRGILILDGNLNNDTIVF